jgi:hypothetical protein
VIQFALVAKVKSGHLDATVLMDVISSQEMQGQLVHAGIDRPSISVHTACCWLVKLRWQYRKQRNSNTTTSTLTLEIMSLACARHFTEVHLAHTTSNRPSRA